MRRLVLSVYVLSVLVVGSVPDVAADEVATEGDTEPALVTAEARIGHGFAMGGGSGMSRWRRSGFTFSALADIAVVAQPWTTLYGGVLVEGHDRATVGVLGGARVKPGGGRGRLSAGLVVVALPVDLWGVSAAAGHCWGDGGVKLCADIEGMVFGAGDDLPEDRIATQLQLVVGVAFDAM